ncbi:hypothetical protein D3C76_1517500 [compost metagenome]
MTRTQGQTALQPEAFFGTDPAFAQAAAQQEAHASQVPGAHAALAAVRQGAVGELVLDTLAWAELRHGVLPLAGQATGRLPIGIADFAGMTVIGHLQHVQQLPTIAQPPPFLQV